MPEKKFKATLLRADKPALAFSFPPITVDDTLRPVPAILDSVVKATGMHASTLFWDRTSEIPHCFLEALNPVDSVKWHSWHSQPWPDGPFACFGWLRELEAWTKRYAQLDVEDRLQITGGHNCCLIRFGTRNGSGIWFKAVPPEENEFGVTQLIARGFAQYSPPLLAVHEPWHGWISEEVKGEHLSLQMPLERWCDCVRTLARVQVKCTGHDEELLAAGCADFRTRTLISELDAMVNVGAELMAQQPTLSPPPLTPEQLGAMAEMAREVLEQCELPDTLTHNDWGPHNTLVEPSGAVRLIDWAGASIAHPFATIERLFAKIRNSWPDHAGWIESLRHVYEEPWIDAYGVRRVKRSWKTAAAIAVFVRAVRHTELWLADRSGSAGREKVIRSLLRQTKTELEQLRNRKVIYAASV